MDALKGRSGDANVGRDILSKYGYDEDYYKINFSNERKRLLVWNGLVLFLTISLVIVVFFISHYRQKRKINDIAAYLSELNKRNYDLKTKDNDEDDLTLLRNEIFRTTMLLFGFPCKFITGTWQYLTINIPEYISHKSYSVIGS